MDILFIISACVAIFSALMVITRKNAVHALLYMVVSFFAVALIFYLAGAPFVAVMEVIIYAGAIVTLFVFVVMMLNMGTPLSGNQKTWKSLSVWLGPVILVILLQTEFLVVIIHPSYSVNHLIVIEPHEVALAMMTKYMLAIELTGMLLLAGIIGAFHLGRRKRGITHRYLEQLNKP